MVSQLLFAETFRILEKEEGWVRIRSTFDNYVGWVDAKQVLEVEEEAHQLILRGSTVFALDLVRSASSVYKEMPVVMGSPLPFFRNNQFSLFDDKYKYDGPVLDLKNVEPSGDLITKVALKFLNAPYLWGGRTPLGVDCSGFVQAVFRFVNIQLNRDSRDQAEQGFAVDGIEDSKTGDLSFFTNQRGKISHVGIMFNNNQIIHAHGCVRIDPVDHRGIFNTDIEEYSHRYAFTKRLFK